MVGLATGIIHCGTKSIAAQSIALMPDETKTDSAPVAVHQNGFQFSLRGLLVLVALLAAAVALISHAWRQFQEVQRQSKREWKTAGKLERFGWEVVLRGEYDSERIEHIAIRKGTKCKDLTLLAGLTRLRSLSIYDIELDDLTSIAEVANLREFNLYGNPVSDLTPIARLKNLESLGLGKTQVNDLTPLVNLTNLKTLAVYDVYFGELDLTSIARLTNLERLILRNTQVSDLTQLSGLKRLKELQLDGTQVSDLMPLHKLAHLERLSCKYTNITVEQVDLFVQAVPQCHVDW